MDPLMQGVSRFRDAVYSQHKQRLEPLGREGQNPATLMISCSDSRVVPELITQSEPGELFVIRNAGNIVPPWQRVNGGVTSTIEYAVVGLGVTDIVICGHADCGAMKAHIAPEGALDGATGRFRPIDAEQDGIPVADLGAAMQARQKAA